MKLSHLVTDYDNRTLDTGRTLAVVLSLSLTVLQLVALVKGQQFDALSFGGGQAAILGALGIAIGGDNFRRPERREPDEPPRRLVRPHRVD